MSSALPAAGWLRCALALAPALRSPRSPTLAPPGACSPTHPPTRVPQLGSDYDNARLVYGDGPDHPRLDPGAEPAPKRRAPNPTGGVTLGSAAAAVAAAGALPGPQLRRCELCAATFGSEREMALHLEGAAHRRALERQAAEAERRRRLGAYADVASAAVEAAAWHSGGALGRAKPPPLAPSAAAATGGNAAALGGGSGPGGGPPVSSAIAGRGGGGGRGGGRPQQPQQGGRGRGQVQPAPAVHARELTSHAEMLRQARGEGSAPLDIDGWVPPAVPLVAAPAAAAAGTSQQQRQAAGQPAAAAQQQQQQRQQQEEAGGAGNLLGGLLSYSDDEDEGSGASGRSSQEGVAPGAAADAREPRLQQEQRAVEAAAAAAAGADSGSDSSGSSSESEGEEGAAPAAFFTF